MKGFFGCLSLNKCKQIFYIGFKQKEKAERQLSLPAPYYSL